MFKVKEFDQLERFNAITNLSNALSLAVTNTPAWLCLWFADLACIRQLTKAAKDGVNRAIIREIFDADSKVMSDMLRAWMDCEESPLRSYPADSDDDSSETSTVEVDDGEAMTLQRDKTTCPFTKSNEVRNVTSIYPRALSEKPVHDEDRFWNRLRIFWSEEKVNAWRDASRNKDSCRNLLTMKAHVAQYWDTAQMALKPVDKSDDGTSLTVEVYWMPTTSYGYSTAMCSRPELKHMGSKDAQVELWDPVGKKKMEPGHRVTFETDDPEKYPLPAWELLEMRWDLNWIAKLAGVIEMYGRDDYESEEGESSDEEDEVEDEVEYKDDPDDSEEGDDNGEGGGISVMGFFPGLGHFLPLRRPGTDGKLFEVDEEKLKEWEENEKEDGGPEPEPRD